MLTIDAAVHKLRADPLNSTLIRESYLDQDTAISAERFLHSGEWLATLKLLTNKVSDSEILDLGAGSGIASYAFCKSGARRVYAVEPDPSSEVGQGAIQRIKADLPIEIIGAFGEAIPLPDQVVDICYTRQVLHHIRDLPKALKQCARLLKPGGLFLACREHVVDNSEQLAIFLAGHPMHQLAGGENAYSLNEYIEAIRGAGLTLLRVVGPWDSVINAYPAVYSDSELSNYPKTLLTQKFGSIGTLMSYLPAVKTLVWRRLKRPVPGRMYSFLAVKP